MAFDRDLAMRQLVGIYQNAYNNILETIAEKKATGNSTQFQQELLADIQQKLAELDASAEKWSNEVIPTAYKNSQQQVLSVFDENDIDYNVQSSFAQVHDDAISVLQQNFYDNMAAAHNFVGRQIQDKIRNTQLGVVTEKVSTGKTITQAKKQLIQELGEQGITAYTDDAGRKWTLDRYAEMSVRTVTSEATNKGTFNQLRSMDRDLVQLTSHASPCPICAPLEGRVYSLSGESDRFPSIDRALPDRNGTIHPNCAHRFVPYVPELADNLDRDIKRSNKSFDTDPRTEAAKEAYQKQQKLNKYRKKSDRLMYKLRGLAEGTEEYKKTKKSLETVTSNINQLERDVDAQDAELIDDVWKLKE